VAALDASVPTAYLDLAGRPELRTAIKERFGDRLTQDIAVGLTNQIPNARSAGSVFFAPDQMAKRSRDWGRDGLDARFADAWRRFLPLATQTVDVQVSDGVAGLRGAWLAVLGGQTDPRTGNIIAL
jgi:hypothetical protein